MKNNHYMRFFGMLFASFIVMYTVMFLNVNDLEHIYLSTTRLYMTILMISPMAIIMLAFMPNMYPNKKGEFDNLHCLQRDLFLGIYVSSQSNVYQRQTIPESDDPSPFVGDSNK